MSNSQQHRQVVQRLLESKAVDFTAIGKVISEVGPSLALSDFDGVDGFCGTMRYFIRVFHLNPGVPGTNEFENSVENLGELGASATELGS